MTKKSKHQKGERYGLLTVISTTRHRGRAAIKCLCDCGKETIVPSGKLKTSLYVSCGCYRASQRAYIGLKHGLTSHGNIPPEYRVWRGIKTRCYNKNSKSYPQYGGRGITMSEEWKADFSSFMRDVGPRPSPQHSLDRIDNNGGYFPGNVRWATWRQQAANKRNNVLVTINGSKVPAIEAARQLGVKPSTMYYRIHKGWSDSEIVAGQKSHNH